MQSWRGPALLLAALGLALGCNDATGPDSGPQVSVALQVTLLEGPEYVDGLAEGEGRTRCRALIAALATGEGEVQWIGYRLRLFAGPDRAVPVDSLSGGLTDAMNAWGSSTIAPGQTAETEISYSVSLPFSVEIEFRYRQLKGKHRGEEMTTKATLRCESSEADPPPAQLTELQVTPSTFLQPGAPVTLRYRASASPGIWQTAYSFASASCSLSGVHFERAAVNTAREIPLVLPWQCRSGEALTFRVVALDARGRVVESEYPVRVPTVDEVAPTIKPSFSIGNQLGSWQLSPYGDHFEGDSLLFNFGAGDNGPMDFAYVRDATTGTADTVRVAGSSWEIREHAVLLDERWIGTPELRVGARDLAGNRSTEVAYAVGALRVHPTRKVTPRIVKFGDRPARELLIADSRNLAIVGRSAGSASIVDLTTGTIVREVLLPSQQSVTAVELSFDESVLYFAGNDGSVYELPLDAPSTVPQPRAVPGIDGFGMHRITSMRLTARGTLVLNTFSALSGTHRLLEWNRATDQVTEFPSGFGGHGPIDRNRDGSRLTVPAGGETCSRRWIVATGAAGPVACELYGQRAHDPIQDRFVVRGRVISGATATGQTLGIPERWGGGSFAAAFDPTGETVVMGATMRDGDPTSLIRTRVSDGRILERVRFGVFHDVVVFRDDGQRVVTLGQQNREHVLSTFVWP